MPDIPKLLLFVGAAISGLALLLLIISVATPGWLDDGRGNTIGLFRKCLADNATYGDLGPGCHNENRTTQGGLSVFGLLLLAFGLFAVIAAAFMENIAVLLASLGLLYFASMFIMSAYATWGTYSRDPPSYNFPTVGYTLASPHTSMGYSYHLCVAAHYFQWTALTLVAFVAGLRWAGRNK
jgi:hypothetical protein